MQVLIAAASSMLDDTTVLIKTTVTIGEQKSTSQEFYSTEWLTDNRFLKGSLEERIEFMRQGAETVTEKAIQGHFLKVAQVARGEILITEVARQDDPLPTKKARAKRVAKTTTPSNLPK